MKIEREHNEAVYKMPFKKKLEFIFGIYINALYSSFSLSIR